MLKMLKPNASQLKITQSFDPYFCVLKKAGPYLHHAKLKHSMLRWMFKKHFEKKDFFLFFWLTKRFYCFYSNWPKIICIYFIFLVDQKTDICMSVVIKSPWIAVSYIICYFPFLQMPSALLFSCITYALKFAQQNIINCYILDPTYILSVTWLNTY